MSTKMDYDVLVAGVRVVVVERRTELDTARGNIRLIERLMTQVEHILVANPAVSVVTKEVVETTRENLIIGPN
jgi:hypothetical protein